MAKSMGSASIDAMTTLLLFGERPERLRPEEGEAWLRGELAGLARLPPVRAARFISLEAASDSWNRPCDWLAELELDESPDAARLVFENPACADLLADLRQLGMRPHAAVVDNGRSAQLKPC